jgi:ABC-type phosphate transport system substrate-binding protein
MPVGLAAMSVKRLTTLKTTVGTLWLALSFAATCGQTAWCAEVSLKGAGSTFASLLYKKWIEAYRNAAPAVSITYEAVGSGEGIARFTAATVDFAGSDVLMSDSETAKVHNGVIMVPTTAGMIALAYNLPGVKGELKLPRDVYADIFGGVIKRWDDTRIRDPNPGVTLPHLDIVLVARLDASGTTAVFTEHLAAIKPNWRQLGLGVGKIIQWPAGTMLASGSEALAARIKMSEGGHRLCRIRLPQAPWIADGDPAEQGRQVCRPERKLRAGGTGQSHAATASRPCLLRGRSRGARRLSHRHLQLDRD